jgi:hypothetical protein
MRLTGVRMLSQRLHTKVNKAGETTERVSARICQERMR